MGPVFEAARDYALGRLERELDPQLTYHSIAHTRDYVLPAAEQLAILEALDDESLMLIRTAALYHDLGFVVQCSDHEAIGLRIAAEVLPSFGYTPEQIDRIGGMIHATRLPQSPRSVEEQVIADADLSTLAHGRFFAINRALRAEMALTSPPVPDAEWYRAQIDFLTAHCYWTGSAQALWDGCKRRHVAALRRLLRAGTVSAQLAHESH